MDFNFCYEELNICHFNIQTRCNRIYKFILNYVLDKFGESSSYMHYNKMFYLKNKLNRELKNYFKKRNIQQNPNWCLLPESP